MPFSRRGDRLTLISVLLTLFADGALATATRDISINQQTGVVSLSGPIGLAKGDILVIRITDTYPACFTYNAEAVQSKGKEKVLRKLPPPEEVIFRVVHDGTAQAYRIKVLRRADAPAPCSTVPTLDQTIQIETYGWQLGVTGAFTVDKLTDPVFFLEPGTKDSKSGFYVKENTDARDSWRLGLGAMIHLFHSDPQALGFFGSKAVSWAPVTFGLGINTSAQTRYFLGSSIRVSDKFFYTAGCVLGPRKRRPDGLASDGFTENANILNATPTKTTAAFFMAFSYSFIEVGLNRFTSLFNEPTPEKKETGAARNNGGSAEVEGAPSIQIAPSAGKGGDAVKVTLEKGEFSGSPAVDKVYVDGKEHTLDAAPTAGAKEVTIKIPASARGKVQIDVSIKGQRSNTAEFTINP